MKSRNLFFRPVIIFVFCVVAFSPSLSQENLPAIIKKVEPSTVFILTYDKEGEILGQGSGFFISEKGDVITNLHVLQGASHAEVKIAEGKVYPITLVVAEDKEGDLVRVSVDIPHKFVHPLLVSHTIPEIGERVVVIGNPLGLEHTVSDGIISAVREIPGFGKIIQSTASISPGSSGSPVVNMKGEVIGVATFQLFEGQNLNFAIPSERMAKLTPGKGLTLAEWQSQTYEERLTSAKGLYLTGFFLKWVEDYEEALPYFEKAVEKNSRYAEAYFGIGYCKYYLGRYQGAVVAFKQAIRINPDIAEAHYALGRTYNDLGRYQEAIEAYKQSIRTNPNYAGAHTNLGVAYKNLGRYQEAIEAYKQAILLNPNDVEAHFSLGLANSDLGRYQGAVEAFKQAIRINPDIAEAHYALGVVYIDLGRYQEAVEAFKQAIRINPDYAEGHFGLGGAYGNLGRYQEEIEAFKQAIRINPDYAEAHFGLGLTYLLLNDSGSALNEYRILKNLNMDFANQLFNQIYK